MRSRWKIVGGAGLIGVGVAVLLSRSTIVRGDSSSSRVQARSVRNPFVPYPSPGEIQYEELDGTDKASVERVQEALDTSQPPSSYQAFSAATTWASANADRQIAERLVGLTDTVDDGVVP